MAKKSKLAAQRRREQIVERYRERRAALKAQLKSADPEQVTQAVQAFQKMPRDASPTRLRNRSHGDGRPRGFLRHFGLSRVRLRELAHRGELPGVTKSSW